MEREGEVGDTEPTAGDAHPWRAAIGFGVLGIAAGLFVSMLLPLALGHHSWWTPGDAWMSLRAGHYVAQGWYSLIYETGVHTDLYDGGPLFPLLLAPAAEIGNLFHLRESYPLQRQYPGMWSVYAPYALATSAIPLMYAVRAFAVECGLRTRLALLQFLVLALAFTPIAVIYGHYEDALALALLFLAFRDVFAGRDLRGAFFVAAAVCFKQWSLLAIPVYVVSCTPVLRRRAAIRCVLPPALFMGLFLAIDYKYASIALLHPPTYPLFGHSALWVPANSVFLASVPTRFGAVVLAVGVAWFVRSRRDPAVIMTALGCVLFGRFFFESVLHAYYLAPGIACLLVAAALRGRSIVTEVTLAGALLLLFPIHPGRALWWAVFYAVSALYVAGHARFLVHSVVTPNDDTRPIGPIAMRMPVKSGI